MAVVEVGLGERSYAVHIAPGLLGDGALIASAIPGRHVLIVSNQTVAPLYLARVQAALGAHAASTFLLADGEAHKTFDNVGRVLGALARLGASRDAVVVALGGGVVGDLAGFAAATWMRGVAFVQIPTTLLAMVDSSVGGKTGVNLPQGKNLVGAFHQPRAVFIDPETLATLPARELAAGLAEVVKYAAICDAAFMGWLEAHADALAARDARALQYAIEASVRHKARVVAADEHERGERALLNFGHTFGHALEAATGYTRLLHGEAVAIGMTAAAQLSATLAMAPMQDADRLEALLARLGLPTRIPADLAPAALLALMRLDKKAESGKLRLILWRGIGRAEIAGGVADAHILDCLARMREP